MTSQHLQKETHQGVTPLAFDLQTHLHLVGCWIHSNGDMVEKFNYQKVMSFKYWYQIMHKNNT